MNRLAVRTIEQEGRDCIFEKVKLKNSLGNNGFGAN